VSVGECRQERKQRPDRKEHDARHDGHVISGHVLRGLITQQIPVKCWISDNSASLKSGLGSTWEASLSPAFQLVANGDPLPMLDLGQLAPQRFDAGLKVAASATKEEIVRNYRRKIQQCHPARVAGLAPEFLELAEERSKALNAAYAQAIRTCR
jgi:hypothetical protein